MKIISIIVALSLAIHAGCNGEPADMNAEKNPSRRFYLETEQLEVLGAAAEKGDVEAMIKLSDHYSMAKNDEKLGIYWLERAGDAGDFGARKSVIEYYEQVPQAADKNGYAVALREKWGM